MSPSATQGGHNKKQCKIQQWEAGIKEARAVASLKSQTVNQEGYEPVCEFPWPVSVLQFSFVLQHSLLGIKKGIL